MKELFYRLAGFDLIQFAPSYENFQEGGSIEANCEYDFGFNKENSILRNTITLSFLQERKPILNIQFATFIEIKEESVNSFIKDSKFVISKNEQAQFASFGYGALRGIMYLKTVNTPLEGLILPPVFMDDIFKEPLELIIEEEKEFIEMNPDK